VPSAGFVAVLEIQLHFPDAESLKAKRRDLSSIKAQLRRRLGVSVSETGHHDLWQRATLTAALTGGSLRAVETATDEVERWLLARWPEGVLMDRIVVSVEDLHR